jgi:beta-glucosidase
MTRPVKELKGFQKRFLSPNETVTVSFTIEDSLLSYYNHENKWVVESGSFEIWIAPDSVTGESVSLILFEDE